MKNKQKQLKELREIEKELNALYLSENIKEYKRVKRKANRIINRWKNCEGCETELGFLIFCGVKDDFYNETFCLKCQDERKLDLEKDKIKQMIGEIGK